MMVAALQLPQHLTYTAHAEGSKLYMQVPDDKDNINGMQQLALEATAINQNFSQQVCWCCECDNS